MLRTFIVPYVIGSSSARALCDKLNIRQSRGVKKFRPQTTVINWGNSKAVLRGRGLRVLNSPEVVSIASNKLSTFRALRRLGVPTVEWTTSSSEALTWVDENTVIYARQKLTGSSGEGIVVITYGDLTVNAPMYTKGFNRSHEYRVHVINGRVIDFSKKRRRNNISNQEGYIKNLANGWVFCRDGVSLPSRVRAVALAAVSGLGLDFGAVDILYRERDDEARILEINTAPGLEGTTLERYTETLRGLL